MITKSATKLLEKLSATKYKEMWNAISQGGKQLLRDRGVTPSMDRVIAGLNRGSDNIIRNAGYKFNDFSGLAPDVKAVIRGGGDTTYSTARRIFVLPASKRTLRTNEMLHNYTQQEASLHKAFAKRHEAYEAMYNNNATKRGRKSIVE